MPGRQRPRTSLNAQLTAKLRVPAMETAMRYVVPILIALTSVQRCAARGGLTL